MANKIQLRRDTAGNWTRINPVLADGEPGLDITNNKVKMGDGTTPWTGLPYLSSPEHNRLVSGAKVLTLGTNGVTTIPGPLALPGSNSISNNSGNLDLTSSGGIEMVTGRGSVQLGVNIEGPGLPSHFHINKASDSFDLFLGDDSHYVKLPQGGGVNISTGGNTWDFNQGGSLVLPSNGIITSVQGYTGTTFSIADITQEDPVYPIVITTTTDHNIVPGTKILITGITTTVELNDQQYYVTVPAANQLQLYSDEDLTQPVFGSTNTPYYVGTNRTVSEVNGTTVYATDTSPAGSTHCVVFDNDRYLSVPQSSDFTIASSDDFTVEAYMKFSSTDFTSGYAPMFGTNNNAYGLSILTGVAAMGIFNGQNGGAWIGGYFQVYGTIVVDTWHHIAFVRNAGQIRLYIDGNKITASQGDVNDNITQFPCVDPVLIGRAVTYNCHGTKISNLRVVKGTAVYTGNFTPPTAPLTAISGTKLLFTGDNTITDTSNSVLVPGGGQLLTAYAGADLTIELTSPNPGQVDAGEIKLITNAAKWAFNESGKVTLPGKNIIEDVEAQGAGAGFTMSAADLQTQVSTSATVGSDYITTTGWQYTNFDNADWYNQIVTLGTAVGPYRSVPVTWSAGSTRSTGFVLVQFYGGNQFGICPAADGGGANDPGTWKFPATFGDPTPAVASEIKLTTVDAINGNKTWRYDSTGIVTQLADNVPKVSSGQKTVLVTETGVNNGVTLTDVASLILVTLDQSYNGAGTIAINLPTTNIPLGTRITVINNYTGSINLYLAEFEGPWVTIDGYQNRDYILIDQPGAGRYWWETNSYSW